MTSTPSSFSARSNWLRDAILSISSHYVIIDKNLLLHGLRIRKAVLYVKEILSQHIVLRQEAMTAVRGVSATILSILVRELRISGLKLPVSRNGG